MNFAEVQKEDGLRRRRHICAHRRRRRSPVDVGLATRRPAVSLCAIKGAVIVMDGGQSKAKCWLLPGWGVVNHAAWTSSMYFVRVDFGSCDEEICLR
uniref:Uncharacterized protein n=1 Tax=Steinernema glaseri TaxID=37863 RepID=A0A1I7YWE5_9BILA